MFQAFWARILIKTVISLGNKCVCSVCWLEPGPISANRGNSAAALFGGQEGTYPWWLAKNKYVCIYIYLVWGSGLPCYCGAAVRERKLIPWRYHREVGWKKLIYCPLGGGGRGGGEVPSPKKKLKWYLAYFMAFKKKTRFWTVKNNKASFGGFWLDVHGGSAWMCTMWHTHDKCIWLFCHFLCHSNWLISPLRKASAPGLWACPVTTDLKYCASWQLTLIKGQRSILSSLCFFLFFRLTR